MTIHREAIEITKALISRQSVTPDDAGCQQLMIDYLQPLGFDCETMVFDDTTNLWATKGNASPTFIFAGHTDVVPTGPKSKWKFDPFSPTEHEGFLYGRGAADMKCALAAMLTATKAFVEKHPQHKGQIAFLITSDEEGPFINGTVKVVETLKERGQAFDMCIVGEPSSTDKVGDTVKNGRRGSLSGFLHIHGHQGHVAYPHLADNALHKAFPILDKIAQHHWDNGNEFFPPTSLQITKVESGSATNIIPGEAYIEFNCRFSTEQTEEAIKASIHRMLDESQCDYQLDWKLNGLPFLTPEGKLLSATQDSIKEILSIQTELSTAGGTSDGRFIAQTGCDVIELGVCNESIHKVDEKVRTNDIAILSQLYESVLEKVLL
jgi:succinyl-diaminopimelate desuccinylase